MTKLQTKVFHSVVALLVLGCAYQLLFDVPIYALDPLALSIVLLLTIGTIGFTWNF